MLSLAVTRLLYTVLALAGLTFLVFVVVPLTGDPVGLLLPIDAPEEQIQAVRRSLGLDEPLYVQYWIFQKGLFQGDLGTSIRGNRPVTELLGPAVVNSLMLGGVAMSVILIVGLPAGIIAGMKPGSAADTIVRGSVFIAQAVPNFWLGIILIQVTAVGLRVLPPVGMDGPLHFVLPSVTLAFGISLAAIVRLLRSAILEELGKEYVMVARAKGLAPSTVAGRHVVRNALLPVLTFAGMNFAILVSGSIVVETVFAWPGLGRLAFEAISARDLPVIRAVVLVIGGFVIFVNFGVDLLYGWVDPRIRRSNAR